MIALAIHGGAGAAPRAQMSAAREAAYRAGLAAALGAGYAELERGGSSLDAVTRAVMTLEDDPQFNAGRGAVFTQDGRHELDASIMEGTTRRAGAVCAVRHVRNPILLARAVMEHSPYVLLAAEGAEEFALERGFELVANSHFDTDARREQLERLRSADPATLVLSQLGTVGAVALDARGRLAAATSTGGMTGKRFRRIGDSPLIGAGTYADDRAAAVSSTGHGECFIRAAVAHDIVARMRYGAVPLAVAAHRVVQEELPALGGEGGVIAVDREGRITLAFNGEAMFRASRSSDGEARIGIYRGSGEPD